MCLTAWLRRLRARRGVLSLLFVVLAVAVPASLSAAPARSQTHAHTHALQA